MGRRRRTPGFPGILWDFTSPSGLAGTPFAELGRGGFGTRVGPDGLVAFGPHNLAPKSEGIDTSAPWGAFDFAIQQNALPSPEGPAFLDRLTATSTPNATVYGMTAPVGAFFVRLYVHLGSRSSLNLLIRNGTTATALNAFILQADGSGAANGWTATPVGSGVFRLSVRVSSGFTAGDSLQIYYGATGGVTAGLFWFVGGVSVWLSPSPADSAAYPYIRTTGTARYLPRITHDPALDVNGVPYTVTEQYGANVITDGGFNDPAYWSGSYGASPGWVIAGGSANISGTSAGNRWLARGAVLTAGRTYLVTGDATVTAGNLAFDMGGTAADITTSGPFQRLITVTITAFQLLARTSFVGSIDNISVREYLGTVTTGTPRPLGLLVEGQATNVLGAHAAFENAYWSKLGLSPAPATAGDTLTVDTSNGLHIAFRGFSVTSGVTYTLSCRVRRGAGLAIASLRFDYDGNGRRFAVNPDTGAVQSTAAGFTTSVSPLDAEGFRTLTVTATATVTTSVVVGFEVVTAAGTSWAGDGATSLVVRNQQFETGSVATSYIPNPGTTTALRLADDWVLTGAAFAAAIDSSVGTFVVEFVWAPGPAVGGVFSISNNTNSHRIDYRAGQSYVEIAVGGVVLAGVSAGMSPRTGVNRIAVSWSAAGYAISLNGGTPATGTANCSGLAATQLQLGNINPNTNTNFHLGHPIRSARSIRGQYITGSALQALTA